MVVRPWWLLLFSAGCVVPHGGQPTPAVQPSQVACPSQEKDVVCVEDNALFANGKALTPPFKAIDSFDVSLDRREVVFSAKRDDNFDIGLVSLDGSDIHWVPQDPADEVAVSWAPRGNKISYVVRAAGGDLVRTVHVPTAMQAIADFPYGRVRSLKWNPDGNHYTVTVTSPDASERVESMKYDGHARETVVKPLVKLPVDVQSLGDGVLVKPSLLKYNERVPLVVWLDDRPLEWNAARGSLLKDGDIAIAVVKGVPDALPDAPWIDAGRIFFVSAKPANHPAAWITVPDADVESSASGWIAQHLKEPNGRR